jgi:linoleoyl-CoA desaturase
MPKVTFDNTNNLFFQSVKESVEEYFQNGNIKKVGNWKLYLKAAILIPVAITIYLGLLILHFPPVIGLGLCGLLGFTLASIGFNVMHDACHGSYSQHKWVNELMGLTNNALGGNAYIWKIKHNIIHHTYTNIDGIDDDIATNVLLRQCPSQKRLLLHRYQHLYMFILYAFTSFAWVLIFDYIKYFSKKVYTTPLPAMDTKEKFIFWSGKILYLLFYITIPILCVGWKPWLFGFLTMHVVMGITLGLVFQLAHLVEQTTFEVADLSPRVIESAWAVHEVKTTADFAAKNKIVSWFVGGLNFQIEHHLFPRISHVHYADLSRIVRENCNRFGLPYNYYPSMVKAIKSHVTMMKHLGKAD